MALIQARNEISYISVYFPLAALALLMGPALVLNGVNPLNSILGLQLIALLSGWILLTLWIKSIQSHRKIQIDVESNQVSIHTISPLFIRKVAYYSLHKFGSVRSYITYAKFPVNRLELVTQEGSKTLLIAYFQPPTVRKGFFSIPALAESSSAKDLREKIIAHTKLRDEGFLNMRSISQSV